MGKEKLGTIRTYDEDGYRKRAACVCFKDKTRQEVLLVSSSKHVDRWIIPGGGVEPMEDAHETAIREVYEEAGVRGDLGPMVGLFEDDNKKNRTSVFTFLVRELFEHWEDYKHFGRRRKWFSVKDAYKCLYIMLLKKIPFICLVCPRYCRVDSLQKGSRLLALEQTPQER
ncbi:hypothetical protein ScPMuIL_005630 [Solemya velum]